MLQKLKSFKPAVPRIYLLYGSIIIGSVFSILMFFNFDTDILWHYKIGELITATKSVSLNDTFSWQTGLEFIQHEWLYEVFIYHYLNLFQMPGYFAGYVILFVCLTYGGALSSKPENGLLYLLITSTAYLVTSKTVGLRPSEFSLFILLFMVGRFLKQKHDVREWLLFLIMGMFLANFHGGTILTAVILMLIPLLIGIIIDVRSSKLSLNIYKLSNRDAFKQDGSLRLTHFNNVSSLKHILKEGLYDMIPIMTFIIGTLFNPYGLMLWSTAFKGPHLESTAQILEWKPANYSYLSAFVLVAMILSFGYAVHKHGFTKKNMQLIGLTCALTILGMTSRRCCIMYLAFWFYYGYCYFEKLLFDFFGRLKCFKWRTGTLATAIFTVFAILLVYDYTVPCISFNEYANSHRSDDIMTVLSETPDVKVLAGYTTGNYLLYNDIKCFIDSRQHPYTKEMGNSSLDAYLDAKNSYDHDKMSAFINTYDFDYIWVTDDLDIRWYLLKQDDYVLILDDLDAGEQLWQHVIP